MWELTDHSGLSYALKVPRDCKTNLGHGIYKFIAIYMFRFGMEFSFSSKIIVQVQLGI